MHLDLLYMHHPKACLDMEGHGQVHLQDSVFSHAAHWYSIAQHAALALYGLCIMTIAHV